MNELTVLHDDDDDDDLDYDPRDDQDKESETDEQSLQVEQARIGIPPILSQSKQRAVDEAYQSLFPNKIINDDQDKTLSENRSKNSSSFVRKKKILSDIFGGSKHTVRQLLLHHQTSTLRNNTTAAKRTEDSTVEIKTSSTWKKQRIHMDEQPRKEDGSDQTTNTTKDTSLKIQESMTGDGSSSTSSSFPAKKTTFTASSGLDTILSKINAPEKVSTLTKTGIDWEQFKDDQGLEEELAKKAQGKDAYLLKQEFLQRVDLRRFEQEKAERDKQRAAAAVISATNNK